MPHKVRKEVWLGHKNAPSLYQKYDGGEGGISAPRAKYGIASFIVFINAVDKFFI